MSARGKGWVRGGSAPLFIIKRLKTKTTENRHNKARYVDFQLGFHLVETEFFQVSGPHLSLIIVTLWLSDPGQEMCDRSLGFFVAFLLQYIQYIFFVQGRFL